MHSPAHLHLVPNAKALAMEITFSNLGCLDPPLHKSATYFDDSMTEENWTRLKDEGDIIPCSFTGRIKGERFEELGFERVFTAPQ